MHSTSNGQNNVYNDSEGILAQINDPNIVLKIANSRQANSASITQEIRHSSKRLFIAIVWALYSSCSSSEYVKTVQPKRELASE